MMNKYLIIDNRMRMIEKKFFEKLHYKLIEVQSSSNVYSEISSHVDIFFCKINDLIFVEKSNFELILEKNSDLISYISSGESEIGCSYPEDVKYNICQIGSNVIHNFKYTDKKILDFIEENNLNKINIKQGYSNCSIAVIDEKSAIVTDPNIACELQKNGIEVLLLEYVPDIKLLDKYGQYSKMNGFIGGAMARIQDKIIIFGDLTKIDKNKKIEKFIKKRDLAIVDFKDLDVIDYGGIIEI